MTMLEYIPAPTGGWNPDTPPHDLPAAQAPVLDNMLIYPGKAAIRGPMSVFSDLSSYTTLNVCGAAITYDGIRIARKTTDGVDPWEYGKLASPTVHALGEAALASSASELWIPPGSGPLVGGTVATPSDALHVGPRSILVNGVRYGITYQSVVTTAIPKTSMTDAAGTYTTWLTRLYKLNHAGVATLLTGADHRAGDTADETGVPVGPVDLAWHLSRIWTLGGTRVADTSMIAPGFDAGVNAHENSTLWFSEPHESPEGANWRDPISGYANRIALTDNGYGADYGVALQPVQAGLLIFRRNSVWILRGTTSASFTLCQVTHETGCVDARSVVTTDSGVYFVGPRGLMVTDGSRVRPASGAVSNSLQAAVRAEQLSIATGGTGHVSAALLQTGHLLVTVGSASTPAWAGLYDISANAWTRITSQLFKDEGASTGAEYPGWVTGGVGAGMVCSLGKKYVTLLERGQFASCTADLGLYDKKADGTYAAIPACWKTRPFILGTKARKYAQGKRWAADFAFQGTSVLAAGGWAIEPQDASGTSLQTATTTPAAVAPGSARIQRINTDFTNELVDPSFTFTWTDSARSAAPTGIVAEVYGLALEYQVGRDLR